MLCVSYLFRAHQTHYEQFGRLSGAVNIDGYSPVELSVIGVRDHSYGRYTYASMLHCFLMLLLCQQC